MYGKQQEKIAPRPCGWLHCWDSGPSWGSESISSSLSDWGGAARLAEGWGVSLGSIGVPVVDGLGVIPLTGVSTSCVDRLLGVSIDEGKGADMVGSLTWPPISWWVGSWVPNGIAGAGCIESSRLKACFRSAIFSMYTSTVNLTHVSTLACCWLTACNCFTCYVSCFRLSQILLPSWFNLSASAFRDFIVLSTEAEDSVAIPEVAHLSHQVSDMVGAPEILAFTPASLEGLGLASKLIFYIGTGLAQDS